MSLNDAVRWVHEHELRLPYVPSSGQAECAVLPVAALIVKLEDRLVRGCSCARCAVRRELLAELGE